MFGQKTDIKSGIPHDELIYWGENRFAVFGNFRTDFYIGISQQGTKAALHPKSSGKT